MFFVVYLSCGVVYCFYTFSKIVEMKEKFLKMFYEQFGEDTKLEYFVGFLLLSSIFAWPLMILGEISKKDSE